MWFSLLSLVTAPALAADARVVLALGDGVVVAAAAGARLSGEAVPGGLAAVLGDCLEERAPKRFSVVDRTVAGETLASVRPKLPDVAALAPQWVIVTLGARELADPAVDAAKIASDVAALAAELGVGPTRTVLVVGALPAEVDGDQAALDARVAAFNQTLSALAVPGLVHLDPAARGRKAPRDGLVDGSALSPAGQARIAAGVCDVVLARP